VRKNQVSYRVYGFTASGTNHPYRPWHTFGCVSVGCDPLFGESGQVGSLAGAAYLLDHNAGVLSEAQCEQESHVAHKGKKPR